MREVSNITLDSLCYVNCLLYITIYNINNKLKKRPLETIYSVEGITFEKNIIIIHHSYYNENILSIILRIEQNKFKPVKIICHSY